MKRDRYTYMAVAAFIFASVFLAFGAMLAFVATKASGGSVAAASHTFFRICPTNSGGANCVDFGWGVLLSVCGISIVISVLFFVFGAKAWGRIGRSA